MNIKSGYNHQLVHTQETLLQINQRFRQIIILYALSYISRAITLF